MDTPNNQANQIRAENSTLVTDWGDNLAKDFERGDWVRYLPPHTYYKKNHPDVEYGVVSNVKTFANAVHVRFLNRRLLSVHNVDNMLVELLFGDRDKLKQVESRDESIIHLIKQNVEFNGCYDFTGVTGKYCSPENIQRIKELENILLDL